ncbi:hypothetical protein POVWA1_011990 [Plasmodium ovale wallikeri]|uniref:Uncharacterized protein n=1 Tax=Plasmodium ovale wallikeri TaxID=864142 RepID=A0A1A8YLF2_PLAOA|nr:hypothetical protein POVWA1_011990 [Plasmodium ovale wallikeri]
MYTRKRTFAKARAVNVSSQKCKRKRTFAKVQAYTHVRKCTHVNLRAGEQAQGRVVTPTYNEELFVIASGGNPFLYRICYRAFERTSLLTCIAHVLYLSGKTLKLGRKAINKKLQKENYVKKCTHLYAYMYICTYESPCKDLHARVFINRECRVYSMKRRSAEKRKSMENILRNINKQNKFNINEIKSHCKCKRRRKNVG